MANLLDILPGGALLDIGKTILDRVIPDKNAAAAAKAELERAASAGDLQLQLGQMQVNLEEAKSTNWFVAGWRPYIGWVCGTGLGYQFLFMPILNGLVVAFHHTAPFPMLDVSTLTACLSGLLGLAGMRTFEKHQDVEGRR